MPSISLSTYTMRTRDTAARAYVRLDDFADGLDLLDVMQAYLDSRRAEISHDPERRMLLRIVHFVPHGRSLSGIMEKGEYGFESSLWDVEEEALSYSRRTRDAEMLPFYFHIALPANANEGVVALQRFGPRGIKGVFLDDCRGYLGERFADLRLELNPLAPERLLRQYLDRGRIVRIRFVRFGIPSDIADRYDIGHREEEGTTELRLSAKRKGQIPLMSRVLQVIRGDRDVDKFIELQHFEYDTVKVELEVGARRRTVDLLQPNNIRADYDITGDVEMAQSGHPSFESIDAIARELVAEILQGIGTDNSDV